MMEEKWSSHKKAPLKDSFHEEVHHPNKTRDLLIRASFNTESPPSVKTSHQISPVLQTPPKERHHQSRENTNFLRQKQPEPIKKAIKPSKHDFAWKMKTECLVKLKRSRRLLGEPELYLIPITPFEKSTPKPSINNTDSVNPRSIPEKMSCIPKSKGDHLKRRSLESPQEMILAAVIQRETIESHRGINPQKVIEGHEQSSPDLSYISCQDGEPSISQNSVLQQQRDHDSRVKFMHKKVSFKEDHPVSPLSSSLHIQRNKMELEQILNKNQNQPNNTSRSKENAKKIGFVNQKGDEQPRYMLDGFHSQRITPKRDKVVEKSDELEYLSKEYRLDRSVNKKRMPDEVEFTEKVSARDQKAHKLNSTRTDWFWFDKTYLKLIEQTIQTYQSADPINPSLETPSLAPTHPQLQIGTQTWHKQPNATTPNLQTTTDPSPTPPPRPTTASSPSRRVDLGRLQTCLSLRRRAKRLPPPPLADAPSVPMPPWPIRDELEDCRSQITRILGQHAEQASVFCWSKDEDGAEAKAGDARTEKWNTPHRGAVNPEGAKTTTSSVRHVGNYLIRRGMNNKTSTTRKNSQAKSTQNHSFGEEELENEDMQDQTIYSARKDPILPDHRDRLKSLPLSILAKYGETIPRIEIKDYQGDSFQIGSPILDSHRYSAQEFIDKTSPNRSNPFFQSPLALTLNRDEYQKMRENMRGGESDLNGDLISDRAGYKNKFEKGARNKIVNTMFKQDGNQVEDMLMDSTSPRSLTSSGISPIYPTNKIQINHRTSKSIPQINLKALIEQNEEVESREVTPRIPGQDEGEEKTSTDSRDIEPTFNTINLFVRGLDKKETTNPPKNTDEKNFDHQKLTSLIQSQLMSSSLKDEETIGDKVGIITNQLVNIFDKMHRLGGQEDFEEIIESVDQKHSNSNRSLKLGDVADITSIPESLVDWKSVKSHLTYRSSSKNLK
jgi:hypothetical protein